MTDWTNPNQGDWTSDDDFPVPFGEDDSSFAVPDTVAPSDADAVIQKQLPFSEIEPGTHELVITGILNTPKPEYVNCYVKGPKGEVKVGYETLKVTLKINKADNPKASTLFDVYLPPADPEKAIAYWHGVPEGKKAGGWHAHTFRLLMSSAIAPWPQGQPMPPMVKDPRNWFGRRFIGTVDPPDSYTDKNTGEQKMGKAYLNQRSFRPAPGQAPLVGPGGPATGQSGGRPAGNGIGRTVQAPQAGTSLPAQAPAGTKANNPKKFDM
jgi:hypothetical protein